MSIKDYQSMLETIKEKIVNDNLKYHNTVIIGDNSSGKSEILKNILESDYNEKYYFIDSINRVFDYLQVTSSIETKESSYLNVNKGRLLENNFNIKDSFSLYGEGMGGIESIYTVYKDNLISLINEFFDIDFKINIIDRGALGNIKEVSIDGESVNLSNGYQAIIRIFLELLYFESFIKEDERKIVIIDEVNEFLSTKNEIKIMPFLISKFKNIDFIITTHSADVIANLENFNIIALSSEGFEFLDGNDYDTVTDVRAIFDNIYGLDDKKQEEFIDIEIRNLLNMKIAGKWELIEEDKLKEIEKKDLSNNQKFLINQIKSW